MKHFEVLAAAMTVHMVVSTDRDDLYVGQYHDSIQMCKGSLANTVSVPTMKGVKTIQPSRTHALSRVIMESIKMGLASSVLLGPAGISAESDCHGAGDLLRWYGRISG